MNEGNQSQGDSAIVLHKEEKALKCKGRETQDSSEDQDDSKEAKTLTKSEHKWLVWLVSKQCMEQNG